MSVDIKVAETDDAAMPSRQPFATPLLIALLFTICAVPAVGELTRNPGAMPATVLLGTLLAALATIDLRTYRLPDWLTLSLACAGLLLGAAYGWDDIALRLAAVAAGFGSLYLVGAIYERVRGRAGLGLGDAKLLGAGGAWVGLEGLAVVLLIGCVTALLTVAALMATGRTINATTRLPFGPFLGFGIWLTWLYGPILQ